MIITRAVQGDVDTIMRWRRDRAQWIADRGEDQWRFPLPRCAVAATVAAGQTWIVRDGDRPAGTITLTAWHDVEGLWKPAHDPDLPLWLPEDDPSNALYAAKMIVPQSYAGGLGREMLDWAAGRAYAAELRWLRIDVWTTNTGLQDYYRRQGFEHVRTVAGKVSGACFQRPAAEYHGTLKTDGD